jgi:aconitate hydratase
MFARQYDGIWEKNPKWNAIKTSEGELYEWDADSTYIQEPPFLEGLRPSPSPRRATGGPAPLPEGEGSSLKILPIVGARCLAAFGDSVTTDHISPAGSISKTSPAGQYLISLGVAPSDFNSYGARRGNDRVMTRGTFANIRIRNLLAPGTEGGVTRHLPDGVVMSIYDAAMKYKAEGVPLVVLAGAEYGSGSSRDWAAKGPFLQGVRAVLAASFERIHRSNLVMMGILPLEFEPGTTWQSLGLTGEEVFNIPELGDALKPRQAIHVIAKKQGARSREQGAKSFSMIVRIDTPVELDYYRNGGILQTVLRKLMKS